jgi:enamine deaminase RidA (YjgF/YER057c/UK114 family)
VSRTWIYLREMERDYGELNRARRVFFDRHGVERRPASTGIGGPPILPENQTALTLYAVVGPAEIATMHTPTLNEAHEYGSDFSRGMSVEEGGRRTLYISGTASVDEEGRTVHLDDFDAQAERMLLNIEMLLENDRATFADMASAITYLKDLRDAPKFLAALERRGITDFPHSIVKAEVCRPELLCEMEGIAVVPARS